MKNCDHDGFITQRRCRKHVKTRHEWFYYFDERPEISSVALELRLTVSSSDSKSVQDIPSLSKDISFAQTFLEWLIRTGGGGGSKSQADQVLSRILKFLPASNEDFLYDGISNVDIDFFVGSTENVRCFLDILQNEWRIGNSGQISYIHALIDLIDFQKLTGVSSTILYNFAMGEVFLKRARRYISKKMRMNFSMELDIETLERKGHWATMKELQHVIPFHLPRYKRILKLCKKN